MRVAQIEEAKRKESKRSAQCKQCYSICTVDPESTEVQKCWLCQAVVIDPSVPQKEEEVMQLEKLSQNSLV